MSDTNSATDGCILEVAKLFERINEGRMMRSLPPVENNAMASRCNLRFNLDKNRGIDFNQGTVTIARADIEVLEQLVNEQFNCKLEGVVERLCVRPRKTTPAETLIKPVLPELSQQPQPQPLTETESGLLSRIKKIFGGE